MLKKIFVIAFLTGAAQLFSIYVLKFLSTRVTADEFKFIGQVDSLIFLLMNLLALGLQSDAIRNIAINNDWKSSYSNTQQARITLGLILSFFSFFFILKNYYSLFLLAPIMAMSGDYALYARNHPVTGAAIAFFRVFFPYLLMLLFALYQPNDVGWIYGTGFAIIYIITNVFIAKYLNTNIWYIPDLRSLFLYIKSIKLGITMVGLYFIGQGLILITPYFYSPIITAVAFIGLKFYLVYKGLLRILHQSFVSKMINDSISLKVDQLSILAGIMFLGSVAIFPNSFISLFFGNQFLLEKEFFILLAAAGLVYALFLSRGTKSMLLKMDHNYMLVTLTAACITILLLIVFSFYKQTAVNVALSILIGEIIWTIGLYIIAGTRRDAYERIKFLFQNMVVLLLPLFAYLIYKDHLITYLASFSIVAVVLLALHRKKFE